MKVIPFTMALVLGLVATATADQLSFPQLKMLYERKIETIEEETKAARDKLAADYRGQLEVLLKEFSRKGQLDPALQVKEEIGRIEKGELDWPKDQRSKAPEKLLRLRGLLDRALEKVARQQKEDSRQAAERYADLLEDKITELTKAGKLEEAVKVREAADGLEAAIQRGKRPVLTGKLGKGNIALARNGAKAFAQIDAASMIDGKSSGYTADRGYARAKMPCEMTVELAEVYIVSAIRILLFDLDDRRYKYDVEISADGEKWEKMHDHSDKWAPPGWQEIEFDSRDTRFIRVNGKKNTVNREFHIVEIEAYSQRD